MYQENKNTINWVKIFLRVLIAFLLVILSIKLVSIILHNRDIETKKSNLVENLQIMDTFAKDYFKGDNLPNKVGESKKVFLKELIEDKKIETIKDKDGKECNFDSSFIKITKLDTEYQIQSSLVCDGESDYLNSFIEIKSSDITIKPATTTKKTTTTKRTTKKTTKRVTTTTKKVTTEKKYIVSFNSNGGSNIITQKIKPGNKLNYLEPSRSGYKFIGWYYRGNKFNFNTKINQDYVLVAKWIKA